MRRKRLAAAEARAAAKERAAEARAQAVSREQAAATVHTQAVTAERVTAAEQAQERDVAPWLRQLGFRPEEVRRGVELCAGLATDAPLEERVRLAVSSLARGGLRRAIPGVGSPG